MLGVTLLALLSRLPLNLLASTLSLEFSEDYTELTLLSLSLLPLIRLAVVLLYRFSLSPSSLIKVVYAPSSKVLLSSVYFLSFNLGSTLRLFDFRLLAKP